MTKFNKFDKKNLQALRDEMNAVLQKYGADANLEFEVGNMKFSDAEGEIKVKAKVSGAKTQTDAILETQAAALGLKIENKKGERLIEYRARNWKMPFIFEGTDGRRFKCDEKTAKMKFSA